VLQACLGSWRQREQAEGPVAQHAEAPHRERALLSIVVAGGRAYPFVGASSGQRGGGFDGVVGWKSSRRRGGREF